MFYVWRGDADARHLSNCGKDCGWRAPPSVSMMGDRLTKPREVAERAIPATPDMPAVPRVEYEGFWVRFLAWVIDNVVMGVGVVRDLIPLICLRALRGFMASSIETKT